MTDLYLNALGTMDLFGMYMNIMVMFIAAVVPVLGLLLWDLVDGSYPSTTAAADEDVYEDIFVIPSYMEGWPTQAPHGWLSPSMDEVNWDILRWDALADYRRLCFKGSTVEPLEHNLMLLAAA